MLEFAVEKIPLQDASPITLETLTQWCAMKVSELEELMDYNALQPVSGEVFEFFILFSMDKPVEDGGQITH